MARRNLKTTKTAVKKISSRKTADENKINPKLIEEKIEKDKHLIMWSGVTFFMALILTFWIFNIKTIFKTDETKKSDSPFQLTEITEELGSSINEFRKSWNEAKTEENFNFDEDVNKATSSELTKEEIKELKIKIEELEKKINEQKDN